MSKIKKKIQKYTSLMLTFICREKTGLYKILYLRYYFYKREFQYDSAVIKNNSKAPYIFFPSRFFITSKIMEVRHFSPNSLVLHPVQVLLFVTQCLGIISLSKIFFELPTARPSSRTTRRVRTNNRSVGL